MVRGPATSTLAADHARASSLSRRAKTSVKTREASCHLIGKPHAARRAGKETQQLDHKPGQPSKSTGASFRRLYLQCHVVTVIKVTEWGCRPSITRGLILAGCQQSFLEKLVGSACIHAQVKAGMARSFAAVLAAASIMLQPTPALAEADLYRCFTSRHCHHKRRAAAWYCFFPTHVGLAKLESNSAIPHGDMNRLAFTVPTKKSSTGSY